MRGSTTSRTSPPSSFRERLSDWYIRRALRGAGPLVGARVDLPGTDVSFQVLRPEPRTRDAKERAPHWAEIWPSGVVLAGAIAREPSALRGKRVLEIGPGVGITAVAALRAGAELAVADYDPAALAVCAHNAFTLTGIRPRTLLLNWRAPTPGFFAAAGDGYAIVLAADVAYRAEDVKPLRVLLDRIVAPGGELWLAEPGRDEAERLVRALLRRGWHGTSEACACPLPDPHDRDIDIVMVHHLRRQVIHAAPSPVVIS